MHVHRSAVLLLLLSVLIALPALSQVPDIELIDVEGRPALIVLESSRVFVRVTDPDANYSDTMVNEVTAQVSSALAADAEEVTLTETGPETGVFEGWVPLDIAGTPPAPQQGDGDLETARDAGPPYQFDTLTATYTHAGGSVSDTVAVAGSRTSFLDRWGNPASSLAVGSTVRVQVEDQNLNNPTIWDSVLVSLYSLTTGDEEELQLQETSRGSGVFEKEVRLAESPYYNPEDDDLQVQPNEQVEARHTDITGDTASGALATVDLLSLRFVDDQGQATTELVESGIARIQVFSLYDNASSGVDAIAVQIASQEAGDQELVTLTETGPDTGIFEGSIRLSYAPGIPGNSRLETANSGAPDYEADQVTASFGPFSTTARTVASRILFLDAFGRPASSYPVGSPIYLRVIDQNANDPTWLDETVVVLRVPGSGEMQSWPLLETGYDTGVFEGALPTAYGTNTPFDGRLQGWIGLTIEAEHDNSNSPDPTVATAVFTGSSVLFVDADGQPATVYLEGSEASLRVVAPLAGTSTVTVDLSTALSGDIETLTLDQTAPGSGIYEGSIRLRPAGSAIQQWDGDLQTTQSGGTPHQFDTLRAIHEGSSAEVGLTGSRIEFLDAYGAVTGSYASNATAYVRIEDQNFNNPGVYDTVTVTLTSPQTGDVETRQLLETGRETGIFTGSVPLVDGGAGSPEDGSVQAPAGSRIVATHQNAMGFSSSRAEALIEDSDVLFIDEQGVPTAELVENGTARVRVVSHQDNLTSGVDTVEVELRSLYSGDQELVILTETGPDTGVFEGSISLYFAPGDPGNSRLETGNSGNPEHRQDTVTATFNSQNATARTVGSRVLLVDAFGRETDRYALGSPVYLRVIDPNANEPQFVDNVGVTVRVPGGDQEFVDLTETGFDTGVFEGMLPTAQGFNLPGDGRLQGAVGLTIEAEHENRNSPHPSRAAAVFAGGSVLFVDAQGQPASVYLEGSEAHVRVVAPLAGTSTVTVGLSAHLSGDVETLTLDQTEPGSGIYEGSIRLRPVGSATQQWDGDLQTTQSGGTPHEFDTLRAVYGDSSAEVGLTGSRIEFIDAYGAVTDSYASGSRVYVRLEEHNSNTPGHYDSLAVTVTAPDTGDVETLNLLETEEDSGIFEGSRPLDDGNVVELPQDGKVQVQAGSRIVATYQNAMGFSSSQAEALIEDADLLFIDEQGVPTAELLENGTARLRVFSRRDNATSGADSVQVELRSLYSADQELVTLTETGPETGVFEGSIRLLFAPGNSGSGRLDVSNSGSPEHRQETVTATFRLQTATARTIGSRMLFVDAFGRETDRYALGSPVYLRVIDPSANYPNQVDDVVVILRVPGGEQEPVQLTETGFDTGVFEGMLPTAQGTATPGDGTLQGAVGLAIEAEHGNWNSPHPSRATAVFAGSSVLFVDSQGQPATVYLEGSRAYVRVVAPLAGTSDIAVDLSAALSGDLETLTLTETAPGSGVYEGSIRLRPVGGAVQSGNGTIETTQSGGTPHEFDTLRVFYNGSTAEAGLTGSRLSFLDAYGAETGSYAAGSTVYVRLEDHNRDEPGAVDLAAVEILVPGDFEELLLTETGTDTGIFEGSLPLAAGGFGNTDDGLLVAPAGSLIEAWYLNAMGFTYSRDEVLITDAGIAFVDAQGQPATGLLEGGTARVRVFSTGANATSGLDTVQVELRSLQAGDQELLTLTETGADTNVFEGTIDLLFAPGNSGNNRLETANSGSPEYRQDTVTASLGTVSATARTVGSRIVFLDQRGREVSIYGARSTVRVQVAEPNRNFPGQVESSSIQLTGLDTEVLPLVETGPDTGLFEGSMPSSEDPTPSGDGILWHAREVTASYGNYNSPLPTTAKVTFREDFVPNVTDDTAEAISGQPVTVAVLANDADPEDGPLTVVLVSQGEHGTVTIDAGSTVTYTSVSGYTGPDTFTYVAADAQDGEARATVTVNVAPDNQPPAALDDLATTPEDQAVTVSPKANDLDPDDDPLDVTAVTQSVFGTAVLNADDTVTFTPAANFSGEATFTYTVRDPAGAERTGTVRVTVTPVDDPPAANNDTATTSEDTAATVNVKANDTDADSPLDVTAVTQGTNGAVVLNADDTVTYTPAADFHGSDSFTYTLSDGSGSDTATVAVTITPVNDAPTANADAASTAEETAVTVTVLTNDSDVDLDTLAVTGVTQGTQGTVTLNPVTYTPALSFHGTDTFTYTVSDGNGGTATATVTVTVTPVNDAPVAVADAATTPWNTAVTVSVLANDVDVDGPSLSISGVTQGANGAVTVNAGQTVTYTPVARFAGTDSFSYTVIDSAGGSATATVTVTVQKPGRISANLQVLYGFNEGSGSTVADISGVGTPLNLTVGIPANVSWLSGGLSIDAPTLIQSSADANKVINAVKTSGALTVEAWIVPANTTQTGPARIVTISQNATKRDVTLGQLGNRFETRLRTSTTSNDGLPAQTTPVGSVTTGLMHVVYTRTSAGAATTYVDGIAVTTSTVGGNLSGWTNYRLGIGNEISSGFPWLGDLYLVAVYSRALPAAEVVQNYAAGSE